MRKRRYCWILIVIILMANVLTGCSTLDMPYNGKAKFQDIEVMIEEDFIRDSTNSVEDFWVFERNNYEEYILLSRRDVDGDAQKGLEEYVDYMKEEGVDCEIRPFSSMDAVFATYTNTDNEYCQEILFAYKGSYYAIALRKGTEERFQKLVNSIVLLSEEE